MSNTINKKCNPNHIRQGYFRFKGSLIRSSPTIFLIIALMFLTACGRKGKLEPDEKDSYPRSYPPSTEDILK